MRWKHALEACVGRMRWKHALEHAQEHALEACVGMRYRTRKSSAESSSEEACGRAVTRRAQRKSSAEELSARAQQESSAPEFGAWAQRKSPQDQERHMERHGSHSQCLERHENTPQHQETAPKEARRATYGTWRGIERHFNTRIGLWRGPESYSQYLQRHG